MSAATSAYYTLSSTNSLQRQTPSSILHGRRRRVTHKSISTLLHLNNSSRRSTAFAVSAAGGSKKKEEVVEEEEDLPWIQEKALDLVEFTGSVTQALPGPRVGQSSFPWILAVPLAYVGITFVFALVKTIRKFNSPKEIRRKLVNKNAVLCKSIDELFEKGRNGVQLSALMGLRKQFVGGTLGHLSENASGAKANQVALAACLEARNEGLDCEGFSMEEIFRKYIRYVLNEKPFNPDLIANLILLRKASTLDDSQVAETLNEISRRIVKDKGPVVMDMSGYSEKGFKRKLAVQALFGKVYYLSELPDFCSRDSSLIVKEIFGVADEDAEKMRMHTVSEAGDMDSLERMVDGSGSGSGSGSDDSGDGSSPIAP